ncbi:MAG: cob(I)yrinic acid a,c-diamide adenosyltransferase [Candidatus Paceibacterota bacterium]
MIVVNTGNGKGKTTAALGAALRAVGRGQKVLMIQFIKGPWKSGEDFIDLQTAANSPAFKKSEGSPNQRSGGGEFKLIKKGLGFVGILGDKLPLEDHKNAARDALSLAKKEIDSGYWDFIILDEVNVAVSLDLIEVEEVLQEVVHNFPEQKILVLTGRGAPQEFIDKADLVTEMKEIKHPYNQGKEAIENVEF